MEAALNFWCLRNHNLFSRLNTSEIKGLWVIAQYRSAEKDEIIYSNTQEIDSVYLLNHGRIKISFCMEEEMEVVSEILTEGDIFGELTLKKCANANGEFAQVLSHEAFFWSFELKKFEDILIKNSHLAVAFSEAVAAKLEIISKKYSDLVFKDVKARVLNFFILHAQYEGKWTGNKAEINMFCTHQDIANFTASSRQTVSSIINELVKEEKIIYHGRSRVIIPDIKKLKS